MRISKRLAQRQNAASGACRSGSQERALPTEGGGSAGKPARWRIAYLTLKIAVIFRLAGSNTARRGCPRPVSGIELG